MRRIYSIRPAESAMWLVGSGEAALRMVALKGATLVSSWPETRATYATAPGERGVRYEIPWVGSGSIALRSRESSFARALTPHGEFLPVDAPDVRFWLFNCIVVVQGALLPGTKAEWLDESRMLQLHAAEFDRNVIAAHPAFRIGELHTQVFLDDTIRTAYNLSGETGLEFDEVWSDEA